MGTIVRPHSYPDGAVARPDHVNANEIILYNEINDNLDWANIKAALQNAANGFVKLDGDAEVPLAQIPVLTADKLPTVIPSGIIVMWSGILATIPSGWSLCDGGGGTPDLRDKFVIGAPAATDPGGTGGSTSHSHTVASHSHTIGSHAHVIGSHAHTVNSHSHTVSSHSHSGGSLEFHRSITLVGRSSKGGDCIALTSGTTSWGLRTDSWYGATGGAAPNTNSKSPGMSSVAPSCSSVAPSCSSESPGTDSKDHLPPYYEIAFIIKT